MPKISEKAIRLILDFEGIDNPWEWPGEESGITIGHGYDLGYEENFEKDWGHWLSESTIARLRPALGKKGERARAIASEFIGVHIPQAGADAVLRDVTVPRETAKTLKVFPGSEALNPDALGALVSLVFNRGTLIDNTDRRKEMKAIQILLKSPDAMREQVKLGMMADLFESMTRLWPNVRGLRRRRIAEAELIRGSIRAG